MKSHQQESASTTEANEVVLLSGLPFGFAVKGLAPPPGLTRE